MVRVEHEKSDNTGSGPKIWLNVYLVFSSSQQWKLREREKKEILIEELSLLRSFLIQRKVLERRPRELLYSKRMYSYMSCSVLHPDTWGCTRLCMQKYTKVKKCHQSIWQWGQHHKAKERKKKLWDGGDKTRRVHLPARLTPGIYLHYKMDCVTETDTFQTFQLLQLLFSFFF